MDVSLAHVMVVVAQRQLELCGPCGGTPHQQHPRMTLQHPAVTGRYNLWGISLSSSQPEMAGNTSAFDHGGHDAGKMRFVVMATSHQLVSDSSYVLFRRGSANEKNRLIRRWGGSSCVGASTWARTRDLWINCRVPESAGPRRVSSVSAMACLRSWLKFLGVLPGLDRTKLLVIWRLELDPT